MPDTSEERRPAAAEPVTPSAPAGDEPRVGVYICHCGGNISDTVRCSVAAAALEGQPNVVVSRDYAFMCSDPGQKLITDDIRENGVNRVVIGACSLFLHEQTFRRAVERAGLNPYLYTHIGLREQDSWVHHSAPSAATEKAIRMMSAGVARARRLRPLEPVKLAADPHTLVIGGGVAGLRAALSLARRGLPVTLVEKRPFLGGHVARWEQVFPTEEDARSLVQGLIADLRAEPNVTIYTGAEVVAASGYVGNFTIRIRRQPRGVVADGPALDAAIAACPVEVPDEHNFGLTRRKAIYRAPAGSEPASAVIDWATCTRCGACAAAAPGTVELNVAPIETEITAGAVVLATGFRPYEPFPGELGYGTFPEVITLPQLERLLAADGPTHGALTWNGRPVRSLALIHCVGSRQIDGIHQPQADGKVNEYCSRVCCTASLAAANRVRARFPEVTVYDCYRDIRTYGRGHEEYYRQAGENRVTFLRYLAEDGPTVVRAEGGAGHPLEVHVHDHLTWGEEIALPVDLVVLAVGMMPGPVADLVDMFKVPQGNDRFLLEVHPKLRPVETAVTGVVLAGTAQAPMNIQESVAAAQAAASKVAVLLGRGEVELEPYVARVDPTLCEGAGECVRLCPQDGAIHMETVTEHGHTVQRAVVTAANCNGCGICVSACPNRAIDVQGWRLDEFEAMVEAITAEPPVLEGVR